jgi:hypothetical protein
MTTVTMFTRLVPFIILVTNGHHDMSDAWTYDDEV